MVYAIIAGIVLSFLSFGGGWIASDANDLKKPPKTLVQNITQVQTTENRNTSIQTSIQEQVSLNVVGGRTNATVSAIYVGKTNVSVSLSSVTNLRASTNKK